MHVWPPCALLLTAVPSSAAWVWALPSPSCISHDGFFRALAHLQPRSAPSSRMCSSVPAATCTSALLAQWPSTASIMPSPSRTRSHQTQHPLHTFHLACGVLNSARPHCSSAVLPQTDGLVRVCAPEQCISYQTRAGQCCALFQHSAEPWPSSAVLVALSSEQQCTDTSQSCQVRCNCTAGSRGANTRLRP